MCSRSPQRKMKLRWASLGKLIPCRTSIHLHSSKMAYITSLVKQFIQANKAKYFGDLETYNMILGCTTSLE